MANPMEITNAAYADGWLMLRTTAQEAKKLVLDFRPGLYELDKAKKKRSLDANAYMWALCHNIAEAVGISDIEVYRRAVQDVGIYREWDNIPEDAAPTIKAGWERQGTGWLFVIVDYGGLPGCKMCRAYYGSSAYNSKQMARLIDYLVQDAESIGLDVMSGDEQRKRTLLLEKWGEENDKRS